MAAFNFLSRHMHLNLDLTPDTSHGVNNDVWALFGELGIRGQMLLWLVAFNVPVGPWQTDARFQECRAALADLFKNHTPKSCPLFQSMAPRILMDPKYQELQNEPDPMVALWAELEQGSPWALKGTKIVKSRFMGFTRKARAEMEHLTARGFGYLFACLEMGFLDKKGLAKLELPDKCGDGSMNTTNAERETSEEKELRSSCVNNMVLACLQYNNKDSAGYLRVVLELVRPLELWHGQQHEQLRTASASESWMLRQLFGGFFSTLYEIVRTVSAEHSLERVQLTLPHAARAVDDRDLDACLAFKEDRLATTMADGALLLAALRMQRCLWMLRGWPNRLVICLRGGDIAQATVDCLKQDWELFQQFSSNSSGCAGVDVIARRSVFHMPCVKQDIAILAAARWQLNDQVLAHIKQCNNRCISSQVCEDAFNRQKNSRKEPNRRGTVERAWATLMEKEVLSSVSRGDPATIV